MGEMNVKLHKKEAPRSVAWAIAILQKAAEDDFFGTLRVKYENGVVQQIVQEQSFKPPAKPPG